MLPVNAMTAGFAAGNGQRDTGVNPYGIGALVVGVIVLVILLIAFRRR
jgi:hypothetical protein